MSKSVCVCGGGGGGHKPTRAPTFESAGAQAPAAPPPLLLRPCIWMFIVHVLH